MIIDLHTATGAVGDFADLDTDVGTDEHAVVAVGLPSAGGHVVGGTPANPFRVDPTGTTTQPVSTAALPLPAGAAEEATLEAARVLLASIDAKDFSTEATLVTIGLILASIDAKDFSTETTLEAARALLASIDGKVATEVTLALLEGKDFATETTLSSLESKDFATETTLATLATEAKLEAVRILLVSLDGKDYATETTQATLATQATLEAARVLLASLDGKDFATQTTLEAARVLLASIDGKVATETTLEAARVLLAAINTAQTDGTQKAIMRSGAKGSSVASDITSTPFDANTEAAHVDIIDSEVSRQAAKLVVAAFHAAALSATTYTLFIDLDDGGGDYKHTGSSSIKLVQISGSIVKSSIGAQWRSIIGIVVAVDATEATMHWLDAATLFALDTSAVEQHKAAVLSSALDLAVASGALVNFAGGFIETGVTDVNTTSGLDNVIGVSKTPAEGDMVLRVTQDSGGGTAETSYSARYLVD